MGDVQASFLVVNGESSYGSIDGILSVLMMLRLYLVGKFIVVHSQLLTDPTTQTVAAVSHIKVNINFVFKVSVHPWTILIVGQFDVALFRLQGQCPTLDCFYNWSV